MIIKQIAFTRIVKYIIFNTASMITSSNVDLAINVVRDLFLLAAVLSAGSFYNKFIYKKYVNHKKYICIDRTPILCNIRITNITLFKG